MFTNYLKTALRNLRRNAFYSGINIVGLSIGIICTILIILYVQYELTYDRHHRNHERIYRLDSDFFIAGKNDQFAVTALPLAPTLKLEYPEVAEFCRFLPTGDQLVKYEDKEFWEKRVYFTDSTVFAIFSHRFLYGSPAKALNRPYCCVLTRTTAHKYFGTDDPIGKILTTGDGKRIEVTAVIDDLPGNSHHQFDGLISVASLEKDFGSERFNDNSAGRFWNIQSYSYILLQPGTEMNDLIAKFPAFYDKYMRQVGDQIKGSFNLMATRLTDLHLHSRLQYELPTGNVVYVYIFIAVAVFILLIACMNYMNMATARSASRAREVGIRKTIGADRGTLVRQFLAESFVFTLIALLIAVIIIPLILPTFNYLAGREFTLAVFAQPLIWLVILTIVVVTGLAAGSYPAFYLSTFDAAGILKGELTYGRSSGVFRRVLVVLQFTISVFMIVGTAGVTRQLNFFRTKDLGFDKQGLLVTTLRDTAFTNHKLPAFLEEIQRSPGVRGAARASSIPGEPQGKVVFRVDNNGVMEEQALNFYFVNYDFIDLMGIRMIAGRQFERERASDLKGAFIVNQTAVQRLNWGEQALGRHMQFGINTDGTARWDGESIGVMQDFNYKSLHNPVEPLVFILSAEIGPQLCIRVAPANRDATVDYIRQTWEKFGNLYPFTYRYIDDVLDKAYEDERKLGAIFGYFAGLTIFIACLGLLGLSAFIVEKRTKEIGVRKIIGATEFNIIWHVAREFLLLVAISNLIAQPLAFYGLKKWLQNFPYQTELGFTIFGVSLLISLLIAVLTVSYQAIKAAWSNPVEALRYE